MVLYRLNDIGTMQLHIRIVLSNEWASEQVWHLRSSLP